MRTAALFPDPGRVLVAVSGGPDSRALFELLRRNAGPLNLELLVGHVDHGIAPESGAWAAAVRRLAREAGVPFAGARAALGAGASETTARRARYRALRRLQQEAGARYVATGHHADDQVETVLLRLLRGSGVAGLAGIAERGPGGLVRPLLPFRRAELRAWLDDAVPGHAAVEDPANRETRHDRVWLRRQVLPILRERFPGVDRDVGRTAQDARRQREAWAALLRSLPALDYRAVSGGIEVARAPLRSYDNALSEAILRALGREAGHPIGPARAARLRAFASDAQSGRTLELGNGWVAETVFDRLTLRKGHRRTAVPPGVADWGQGRSGEASWDGWCINWQEGAAEPLQRVAWSTWVTPGPGVVRTLASGDRVRPLGGRGRRAVRRLLMEARVPRGERRRWPVFERRGDIVWIPGICRGASALPRPGETALRLDAHRHGDP